MTQRRVGRPTLAEEEQRRTIGLDGPDLRVEPADQNLTGSVGDRDDAVGGAEIHADCNRNHSRTALVTTHAKQLYRCGPSHAKRISRMGPDVAFADDIGGWRSRGSPPSRTASPPARRFRARAPASRAGRR